ncbi:phosphoribosylglycinamide formyltransferase [Sandarakinorhabdus sp.]|uniref:phosphoribosylglycinamide formyltransferase n=1 Tax=Sandarakinorhabdus sp. TaxID=1916663 RepID=UPI00286DD960|nr:phosphoribosylglycinamide formyltransferase [Sandarakinorhabdus sp.]
MPRARVAVLISGRGSNMAALLYASRLYDCPYEIVLVASNDPGAAGLQLAAAEGVPIFAHSHAGMKRAAFDAIITAQLEQAGVTHIALAGYMRLLSPQFVTHWQGRCLNIHPSLLPKHKGLHTHEAVLAAGEAETGCTIHIVTPELDDGPILGQARIKVLPGDTPETLAVRVQYAEHQLYPRVLADFVSADSRPEALLERVRGLALSLPAAAEKLSHGSPGFFVEGGKFFAYFSENHHGDGVTALLLKVSGLDEAAMLIEMDPERFFRPKYFGPAGWVGVVLTDGPDWAMIDAMLSAAWRQCAPKRLAMPPI